MKTRHITIMMAALLMAACGHRASQQGATDSDSSSFSGSSVTISVDSEDIAFTTDSIGLEREDTMVSVKVAIDWPSGSNEALVTSIRHYICEQLAGSPMQEGKPEVKQYADGHQATEAFIKNHYKELFDMCQEAKAERGFWEDMQYSSHVHVFKLEETERYVTYLSLSEGFLGGAHGYATSSGTTFSKISGKQIGYNTEYNSEKEAFEMSQQTLFSNPKSAQLAALLKQGVFSYFKQFEDDLTTDEQLKDMLLNVEDINHIPLPSASPYFTKDGLLFIYQQYEIAPYAAGMINFDIPYDKIRPFLTPEAQALID